MNNPDLSLIPMEDLIKEMDNRCISFICAYHHLENDKKQSNYYYGNGDWHDSVALSSILNNDVINNWNNELKYLQKINDERG